MGRTIRILHIDDSPFDAQLAAMALDAVADELPSTITYVQSKDEYLAALGRKDFDIILSDYRMPGFDGEAALKAARDMCPEIPFIMVTGELGEERVIDTLKRGATDYVLKDRIFRLVPAIQRALEEADNRARRAEAEAALRHAHQETSEILESIQDAFYAIDRQWQFTYVNHQAEILWKKSRGEILGRKIIDVFPAAAETPMFGHLTRAMANREVVHAEGYANLIDRWIDLTAYPTNMGGLSVYFRDITARKLAEEKVLTLSRAVEQSPASIVITDTKGTIEYVNAKFVELTGYGREESLGQNPRILKSGELPREEYTKLWQTIQSGAEWRGELHNRKKNGELFWEFASISPVKNPDGEIRHFLAIKEDITERKKAEELLMRQARLIDLSPDAMFVRGMDGRISFWSKGAERLYGYSQPEALGKKVHLLLSTRFPVTSEEEVKRQLQGHGQWQGELHHTCRDGRVVTVESRWILQRDAISTPREIFESNVDITERKRAEDEIRALNDDLETRVEHRTVELRRANKELESFSYSVSHDLKAPLRVMTGLAEMLRKSAESSLTEKQCELIDLMLKNAAQMSELINSLLAFSRAARQVPHPVPVDIQCLVREVVDQQRQESGARGAAVNVVLGELPAATADPVLLRQVFANLLSNAFKFTRSVSGSRIEVQGSKGHNENVYLIRDNGVGFPAAESDKLFQVFKRLHPAAQFEGTGVGLANVRKIVERHGGRVWAESDEGKGATFYFTLPSIPAGNGIAAGSKRVMTVNTKSGS